MKKISWTDSVTNEGGLYRVKRERNSLRMIKKRKANWIVRMWRRKCLLKHVFEGKIEGRIEVTERR